MYLSLSRHWALPNPLLNLPETGCGAKPRAMGFGTRVQAGYRLPVIICDALGACCQDQAGYGQHDIHGHNPILC